ncbi:MAG: transporter [Bacteroidetes bacterium 24-39-8]|nr:MAG: transporter [Bacteroidetes bacterium 24-39-8]OZA68555.1 MAG: transporter [Sphingobacteriia bacterium 39-39-8]HQR93159.1 TolC family protein [Sediminibacterium sp.]HQS55002.1 TolC family protein [Sediminibacterium sp.]
MLQNKLLSTLFALMVAFSSHSQTLKLNNIIDSIRASHPLVKMYDNEIRSMDEAANGARSWMPPQLGFGQFMTPYDVRLWHRERDIPGMGFVMVSGEQMIPNSKKLDADERYMKAMSSVEKEKKKASLNELISDAKQFYFEWIILKKKLGILAENEKILDFMIKNAEIRYKNGLEKISSYYKAKAALGDVKNMQLMFENDIHEKRIRLNALMDRNALTNFDIDTSYALRDYSEIVFDSTLFFTNRSDLKSLDQEINLTQLKQESEKAALKPQFGIRYDNMIGFGGQPMQYTLMGMVKIPMAKWSSKMNKANIESLKWKTYAIQSQKEMMANEYSGMAYGMRNELQLKKKQLKLYEENIIPVLKNNYKTMQLGYEQNTEELFMLYDAWERLNMKQLEYVELINQSLRIQVTIERIIEKE